MACGRGSGHDRLGNLGHLGQRRGRLGLLDRGRRQNRRRLRRNRLHLHGWRFLREIRGGIGLDGFGQVVGLGCKHWSRLDHLDHGRRRGCFDRRSLHEHWRWGRFGNRVDDSLARRRLGWRGGRRGHDWLGCLGRGLGPGTRCSARQARAPPNHGVVETRFDERFLAFALDGTADTVGIGSIQVGHMIGHVDAKGANLRHQILGSKVAFLGQLVHTYLRPRAA